MDNELFVQFQNEMFVEAKRLVPIVYDKNDMFFHSEEVYKNNLNKKYKYFSTSIRLLVIGLCGIKSDGKDFQDEQFDIEHSISHHKKIIEYDNELFNIKFKDYVDLIAKDIIDNKIKYKKQSIFELIPKLAKKYLCFHNDEVEQTAVVLYLNESLCNYGYKLNSTDLKDLVLLKD